MTREPQLILRRIGEENEIPYDLLLLADPSKAAIETYLRKSQVFIAEKNKEIIGAIVLCPLTETSAEIKNIAVKPAFQGKGIGKLMIQQILTIAKEKGYQSLCIGTANASIAQLYIYQKLGFEISEIKRNFFIDNYAEPIYENGIQVKHMIVLRRGL